SLIFVSVPAHHRALHSFPTRRSSDLGDGLQDLVRVDGRGVSYWPYLGLGRWADEVRMASPPRLPDGAEAGRWFLVDLDGDGCARSEEHTSELQSRSDLVCRLLLEKKK